MEIEKQRLIISCVLASRDLMATTAGIIKSSYFDASLKKSVKFIIDYYNQYKDVPKLEVVRAETGVVYDNVGEINKAEQQYIANSLESFCRDSAVFEAIMAGPDLIEKGDYGQLTDMLKSAVSVSLQKDLGIDYFQDVEARLRQTLVNETKISTGWAELDAAIGGGLGRQELIMFAANSGVGKSMTMLNLGRNLLAQGYNGVYISLEMAEGIVSKRLDSMISKVSQDNLLKEMQKVAIEVENASNKMGKFFIKRLPENRTNINHIRSYVQQLIQQTGVKIDFIIGDYIDIMGTTHAIPADNVFMKDKFVTEEFRSLGYDFDCVMISASQLGRSAVDADKLNQSHIAGGISKINTADYVVAIRQDDKMKSVGEINFEVLKSRNSSGVGKILVMAWDSISLVISSIKKAADKLILNKKSKDTPIMGVPSSKQESAIIGLVQIDDDKK